MSAHIQSASQPMVQAIGVSKPYGQNEVLKSIDMTVAKGEVVCLIGPSGSGKSTLPHCMNHLEHINGCTLTVDRELVGYRRVGTKLYELKPSEVCLRRRDIGMVFQHFDLFAHKTVLENIMIAPQIALGRKKRRSWPRRGTSWPKSGCRNGRMTTPRNCRTASSSASPSPAPWR